MKYCLECSRVYPRGRGGHIWNQPAARWEFPRGALVILTILLSLAFSVVILLTAELDRSGATEDGLVRISPQPLIDLQQSINEQMEEEPAPKANAEDTMPAPVPAGGQTRIQEAREEQSVRAGCGKSARPVR
jgi:hypothetical protein